MFEVKSDVSWDLRYTGTGACHATVGTLGLFCTL